MIPLIIGDVERAALKAMKVYALDHPLTMDDINAILASDQETPRPLRRHNDGHYVFLPRGFEVGLTYELQEKPVWHMSMSLDVPGRVPHPAAIDMILTELGLPALKEAVASELIGHVVNVWFVIEEKERTHTE